MDTDPAYHEHDAVAWEPHLDALDPSTLSAGTERLLVVHASDSRQWLRLDGEASVTIGRHPRCRVILEDPYCSRIHCKLVELDGRWMLVHLSGTNPTLLNGAGIITACPLHDGDIIQVGNTELSFWTVPLTKT